MEARESEERVTATAKPKSNTRAAAEPEKVDSSPQGKRKLSFKEQKELAALEAEIEAGERRQAEIDATLVDNSSDAYLVHQLYQERELLTVKLARALDRWAELA
jgi:ATP-binding cassette subfamily F protein uup